MAMIHRALFTWFLLVVFLILLTLRLEDRTQWNWFIVFIPMWFYDMVLLMYIGIHIFNDCRLSGIIAMGAAVNRIYGPYQYLKAILPRLWHLLAVVLKIVFMVMLCLKLNSGNLAWYAVFLPLLILLMGLCTDVFHCLVLQYQRGIDG